MAFALAVPATGGAPAAAVAAVHRMAGEAAAFRRIGAGALAALPGTPLIDLPGGGAVVGPLFASARRVDRLSAAGAAAIASDPDALIGSYWGNYVALVARANRLRLLRAPLGELAAYVARHEDLWVAVSDPALLLRLPGLAPRLSSFRLRLALLDPRITSRSTGLAGVDELLPGEAIDLPGGAPQRRWRPERLRAPEGDPAPGLVDALDATVAAVTDDGGRFGVLLSGGLDSTLVLASLVRRVGPERLVALHHHMPVLAPGLDRLLDSLEARPGLAAIAGVSDELHYAQLAAEAAGVELVIVPRAPGRMDFSALDVAPLTAAPSSLAYRPDADAAETRFVADRGLAALFTGRGGDQVLYASISPLSAADAVHDRRLTGWRRSVAEAARRSGLPLPTVAWLSLRYGLDSRRTRPRPPSEGSFLKVEARRGLEGHAEPWDELLGRLAPGKAAQLAGILNLNSFRENPAVPVVSPLARQPLVEACLAVPTYRLAEGGVSRGLARRAFADRLPAAIAGRLSKAGGTGFVHRLAAAHLGELRERLLGGVLAGTGLLDTARLEARLAEGVPWHELEPVRFIDLLAVECWARQWVARGAALP